MEQKAIQKVALDSCVVIDLIEKKDFADRLRASLRGKSVHIILLCTKRSEKGQRACRR